VISSPSFFLSFFLSLRPVRHHLSSITLYFSSARSEIEQWSIATIFLSKTLAPSSQLQTGEKHEIVEQKFAIVEQKFANTAHVLCTFRLMMYDVVQFVERTIGSWTRNCLGGNSCVPANAEIYSF
jgi:hypothetical protein